MGEGNWGTTAEPGCYEPIEWTSYMMERFTHDNHVWFLDMKYEKGQIRSQTWSINVQGTVIDDLVL